MILCILFLMECTCPSHNLIFDVLLFTRYVYQMGVSLEILTKWYTVEE
jgi:hypothetical protein